jgi:hypothetical protein
LLEDFSEDVEEQSYLQYTRTWLEKTDRGGLYHVSDLCHELFCEIGLSVYANLHKKFVSKNKFTSKDIEKMPMKMMM